MHQGDLAPLRDQGLDDRAIVDANQVVAAFNYVTCIADGFRVEPGPTGVDAACASAQMTP